MQQLPDIVAPAEVLFSQGQKGQVIVLCNLICRLKSEWGVAAEYSDRLYRESKWSKVSGVVDRGHPLSAPQMQYLTATGTAFK